LRLSARILVPPWKVAVAPTTAPEADATVRLCDTAAMFVKETETDPALAVSVVLSNFNRPSGLAARLGVLPAAGAGVAAADLDVAAEEPVELFDKPPQPATASAPASRSIETVGTRRGLAAGVTRRVTFTSSMV